MSITFCCPTAPKNDVPCPYCADIKRLAEECGDEVEKCHPSCTGRYMQSEAPDCNFANANATELMVLVGLPPDCGGDVPVEKLGNVRQRIIKALNRDRSRSPLVREEEEFGGPGTGHCRFIIGANTDEQIIRRLNALLKLVVYAQEQNVGISWG